MGEGQIRTYLNDIFFCKLSPDMSTLEYSTFMGGTSDEFVYKMELNKYGYIDMVGRVFSTDFYTSPGALSETYNEGGDVCLVRFEIPVDLPDLNVEGILNGGFERGDLTYWKAGDTFRVARVSTGPNIAHTGTYGCQIQLYGAGSYHPGSIEQNLTHAEIYSDNVTSLSFWRCTANDPVRVTVTYWDDTNTSQVFTGSFSWQQHFVTGLTAGKRLKKVKFEGTQGGANHGGIDDI